MNTEVELDRADVTRPGVDRRELAAIALGGAVGALGRVGLSQAFPTMAGGWPWTTFAINLVGAFLLGYLLTCLENHGQLRTLRRPLLTTGFCSTFTTFSTVQLELLRMLDRHRYGLAGLYIAASVIGGLFMATVGTSLARHRAARS